MVLGLPSANVAIGARRADLIATVHDWPQRLGLGATGMQPALEHLEPCVTVAGRALLLGKGFAAESVDHEILTLLV
jgi:hypothetical protein